METIGLYRDGTLLIVDLQHYQFPQKCLVSGKRVESEPLPITFYTWAVPPRGVDSFGSNVVKSSWWLGPVQVISLNIRATTIPVGSTSPSTGSIASSLASHSTQLGIFLLVLGTLITVAATILMAIGFIVWQWPWMLVPLSLVVGLMTLILGTILLVRKNWPLRIRRVDCGIAWLAGVHPSLLVPLPSWRDSPAYKAYRQSIGYRRLALGGVACLIGAIAIVTEYQTIVDAISSRQWLSTPGAISSSSITSTRVKTGRNMPARMAFAIEINYTYRVAGVVHTGNRINFDGQVSYSDRRYATSVCERQYPAGQPVTVFYHPTQPERCTLRIATWGDIRQKTWFSLVAFAVGVWGLISGLANLQSST